MTNNPTIDGVSRELIENTAQALKFSGAYGDLSVELFKLLDAPAVEPANELREHCKQCAEVVKTWPEWKRDCLGGAPAVERQEPTAPFYISVEDWNLLVRGDVEIASVRISRTRRSIFTESLFAHPSALQSTIAQLQTRVQELELGLGGMLFAFDDGVGRGWSAKTLDYARKLTPAVEFDATAALNGERK